MFNKLFGARGKADPDERRAIDRKKTELQMQLSIEQLHSKMEELEGKMGAFDQRIRGQMQLALEAKKANQKEKALRYLTNVKTLKNDLVKVSGYSTLLMKQISNLESTTNDNDVAEIIKSTNRHLELAQKQQEANMDVFEDAAALNAEFEANQEQINDIIRQQTERITEGLEEEYAQLDELEMMEAMHQAQPAGPPPKTPALVAKKGSFDDMINELLN